MTLNTIQDGFHFQNNSRVAIKNVVNKSFFSGFGKFNLFSLIATGGCLMCVITETMCAMFIIPAAQCDLDLTLTAKGILYSAGFFGVVASSYIWGYFADTRGRKVVILITLVASAVISFIGSVVDIPWLFIFLRFCNGFL